MLGKKRFQNYKILENKRFKNEFNIVAQTVMSL
jgi:hypothetical protein